jgi:hypothetical protein
VTGYLVENIDLQRVESVIEALKLHLAKVSERNQAVPSNTLKVFLPPEVFSPFAFASSLVAMVQDGCQRARTNPYGYAQLVLQQFGFVQIRRETLAW